MDENVTQAPEPVLLVMCTAPEDSSGPLARLLVEARVAACVNIISGVSSVYTWKGQVTEDRECLLLIKTTSAMFSDLRDLVVKNHPYECPEVVSFEVHSGAAAYLNWVRESVARV